MSYSDLQKKAYSIEDELKVLAVWIDAAKKELADVKAQITVLNNDIEDHEEDLKICKSRDIVVLTEYIFLADCVECFKLKLKDLKVQLAKSESKLEQLEAKKPELQKLYKDTVKQMEKYENNVIPFRTKNGRNEKNDSTES